MSWDSRRPREYVPHGYSSPRRDDYANDYHHDRDYYRRDDHYRDHDYHTYGRDYHERRSPPRQAYRDTRFDQAHRRSTSPREYRGQHDTRYNGLQQRPNNQGFSIRGAAKDVHTFTGQQGSIPTGPQKPFSFRSQGPAFPPQKDIRTDDRPRRVQHKFGQSQPRRFVPRAAHNRDLLRTADQRATTPEQLEGMNDTDKPRFKDFDSTFQDDGDAERIKRRRLDTTPKWSNPDPYTALPPEAEREAKMDIVQAIRKAKLDAAKTSEISAVAANDDFISFSDDPAPVTTRNPESQPSERHAPTQTEYDTELLRSSVFASGNEPENFRQPSPKPAARIVNDRKRKRKDVSEDGVIEVWQPVSGFNPTPWYRPATADLPGLRLHHEICDFYEYVKPKQKEHEVRLHLIERVSRVVTSIPEFRAKGVQIQAFGSFASGLYLPNADMDLVALSDGFIRSGLSQLNQTYNKIRSIARHIERSGISKPGTMTSIAGARVPLLKFVDRLTDLKVDLSFENASGLNAINTFNSWKSEFEAMPAIVVLIKQLLAMHGQNEVHTGGIGGFSIICMVVSMMQILPEVQAGAMKGKLHYGDLLMHFLDLYGHRFNCARTGIALNPPGYFEKQHSHLRTQADRLTIQDPNNPANDISGGSRNIAEIFGIFQDAHSKLQRRLSKLYEGKHVNDSILGACWSANYDVFAVQTELLLEIHKIVEQEGGPAPLIPMPALPLSWERDLRSKRNSGRRISPRRSGSQIGHMDNYRPTRER